MSANTVYQQLHQTALQAPSSSGVYLWRNPEGTVIYVGKAKNLKNRLSSYFSGRKDIKTRLLISRSQTIEYITTANEYEAFLLENNLIKTHKPRYNIDLKDGKSYPVLRITNEEFPRLFKTRYIQHDGSTYFGPFPDVGALDTFIDTLYKLYPIRHCKVFKKRQNPCMYYHIGQCKAPCCSKISKESYNEFFGEISGLLERNDKEHRDKLTEEMKKAAKNLQFEKAARLRDGLKAFAVMQNQNIVEDFGTEDRDYVAFYREGELVCFTVLKIRGGKLLGRDNYRTVSLNEDEELIPEFINAYYIQKSDLPPNIFVPTSNALQFISRRIKETLDADVNIIPIEDNMENASRHKAAMNMAFENAHEDTIRRLRERGDIPALEELKAVLGLEHLPVRIEGFDIAHIGGKFPVASLISFYNGNPDKKNYRYFRLKTTDGVIDDFASMREAATRRYTRLVNEQSDLPDLILIDGGIGQVNAVKGVLAALNLDIPIAGLAKRDEEIYRPGESTPMSLPKHSDALRLLQRIRDETHRFATSRNQRLRTKENTVSIFSELPHVGKKRAGILLKEFTTIENFYTAGSAQITKILGVSDDQAQEIIKSARELVAIRTQKKEKTKRILQTAAATVQKAEISQYASDLASKALLAAEGEKEYSHED
ncbi:excinuclease ABC subunit UvrC [Treponema parvum]|uniref:UvrABC system protein C n=1 Tax=Treponema parvum TaxID=138851 RepID=A0A975ICX6_9SPIR|nr:excinuclease ABC subunit UvrC [Treponema parvum]QTQ12375.1 excinuclease ABC subunit UvrC [Treponema parvum]